MQGLEGWPVGHLNHIKPVMKVLLKLLHLVSVEGVLASEELIVDDSERPDVCLVGVAALIDYFRRHVKWGAAHGA